MILNHSLEHFAKLKPALQELGRIVKANGAVYVAVPDATTFSDRLYRKIFHDRGGHVNLFGSQRELENMISWYTGLSMAGARTLIASFTFLNRKATSPGSGRLRFTRLPEGWLRSFTRALRLLDDIFNSRFCVYGWALYFGSVQESVDEAVRRNVCIRCGQGHPSEWLIGRRLVHRGLLFDSFLCPGCGAKNAFASDSVAGRARPITHSLPSRSGR